MNLKQLGKQWWQDRWLRWGILLLFIFNGAAWTAVWWLTPRNIEASPLHYTIYFGINLTGPWLMLFWLPAIGLVAIISHIAIAALVDHPLWRRLWLLMAAVINLMALLNVAATIYYLRTTAF